MTLASLISIHAYNREELMRREIIKYIDTHTGFWFLFIAASRWFGTVIDIVMAVFQTGTFLMGVFFALYGVGGGPDVSGLGFMIYYTFALLVICQYMLRQSCEVDILVSQNPTLQLYLTLICTSIADY